MGALQAPFFSRPFFLFLPCPPHTSPGNFLPQNPLFLSGTSDLLFLAQHRQSPGAGFWGQFWTGSPPPKKKRKILFFPAARGLGPKCAVTFGGRARPLSTLGWHLVLWLVASLAQLLFSRHQDETWEFGSALSLSRFLGRGCNEALFSKERAFQWKGGRQFSEWGGLVRISTGKAIQWRGPGDSVNRRTLKTEKVAVLIPFPKISSDDSSVCAYVAPCCLVRS